MGMDDKTCTCCHRGLPSCSFYSDKSKKDGLSSRCKSCINAKQKEYSALHKDAIKQYHADYYRKNIEKFREASKEWRENNLECIREYSAMRYRENRDEVCAKVKLYRQSHRKEENARKLRKYYANHERSLSKARERYSRITDYESKRKRLAYYRDHELSMEKARKYYANNKERRRAQIDAWRDRNASRVKQYGAMWKRDNRDRRASYVAARRARKRKAMPKWLTPSDLSRIKMMYSRAEAMSASTGIKHHVDHIIPLQGETVCGLHVPWNLQILTAAENVRKSNKLVAA